MWLEAVSRRGADGELVQTFTGPDSALWAGIAFNFEDGGFCKKTLRLDGTSPRSHFIDFDDSEFNWHPHDFASPGTLQIAGQNLVSPC